ncbi:MAG: hypothetical protein WAS27_00455 [Candidatus Saccharimonadales bacterium]
MGRVAAIWGVTGIVLLLASAIVRLTPSALEVVHYELAWWQWLLLVLWCVFMVLSEGYDGFQKRLVPRIYTRARQLYKKGSVAERVFAPLYCMNYFHAEARRMIIAYTAIFLIITAVIVVRTMSQPWRGIIDCGVVLGLIYGTGALVYGAKPFLARLR